MKQLPVTTMQIHLSGEMCTFLSLTIQHSRFEWLDIAPKVQYDRLTVVWNLKSVVKLNPQNSVIQMK